MTHLDSMGRNHATNTNNHYTVGSNPKDISFGEGVGKIIRNIDNNTGHWSKKILGALYDSIHNLYNGMSGNYHSTSKHQ